MTELTRTEIHTEDQEGALERFRQNNDLIKEVQASLGKHIEMQKMSEKEVATKLDQLLPLADFIPTLEEIAKNKTESDIVSASNAKYVARVLKVLSVVAVIVAILSGVAAAVWGGIQIFKEIK